MTIVVTGGGSGGHITPILAVARELKQLRPDTRIVYISQTGDPMGDLPAEDKNIDEIYHVRAGKLRRYHGEGWRQLLDLRTMWLNLRDGVFILIGLFQSFWLLRRLKPGIIFTRGSFVSVPVCLAAAVRRIPYVTHDSDAIPSLTNRIIAPWATVHAVALPEELYPYPIDKTATVGVPISGIYERVDTALRQRYREELRLSKYAKLVVVTGGGLGARSLNTAVIENAPELLRLYPDLAIVHFSGRSNESEVNAAYDATLRPEDRSRAVVLGFSTELYRYTGAADVVIARAGATNLAELAVQAVPSIIVPAEQLTGGHQIKNAVALAKQGAIIELTEDQIAQELRLCSVVSDLLNHPAKASELSQQFVNFARPDAARKIAELLLVKAKIVQPSEAEA